VYLKYLVYRVHLNTSIGRYQIYHYYINNIKYNRYNSGIIELFAGSAIGYGLGYAVQS
jgi:hypothetical protein